MCRTVLKWGTATALAPVIFQPTPIADPPMNNPPLVVRRVTFVQLLSLLACAAPAIGQLPSGWRAHDWDRPTPPLVNPGEGALPVPPPSDAIILFDGGDLSQWRDAEGEEAKWVVKEGVMESVPGSGYVYTRAAWGDVQLHIEWASPKKVQGKSQGRGNSGVFLMGQYEIQVLDSFDNRTYADGQAAALYGQYPPLVNASRGPGSWQSFDIIFRRPRFGGDGQLLSPARFTVLHNGVLVQDHVEAWGPTSWLKHAPYEPHPDRLPLSLQDHGNPVQYRNIWIRPLAEQPLPPPIVHYETIAVHLSGNELDAIAGRYSDGFRVERQGRMLFLRRGGQKLEMVPRTATEFGLRFTAATIEFEMDQTGRSTALTFEMGGDRQRVQRPTAPPVKP